MQKRTLIVVLAIAALASLLLIGCSGAQGERGGGNQGGMGGNGGGEETVVEKNQQFTPSDVQVSVGDVVVFDNQGEDPHEVDIDGKRLGIQDPGDKVEWTAQEAGTYPYMCTIHPNMTGTVTVK